MVGCLVTRKPLSQSRITGECDRGHGTIDSNADGGNAVAILVTLRPSSRI